MVLGNHIKSINKLQAITILLLSLMRTGSMHFYYTNIIIPEPLYLLLNFIGSLLLLTLVFASINHFLDNQSSHHISTKTHKPLLSDKKYFWYCALFLAVIWLPFLIIKYPGAMNWDTWVMYDEYVYSEVSEYHSVFYVYFMGAVVSLFDNIGNINNGLFVFVSIHYVIYVLTFAYSLVLIRKLSLPRLISIVTVIIYVLNPYITGYIGVAMKDTLYSVLVFASILLLIDIYTFSTNSISRKKLILFSIIVILACLVRKNGIYVYVITCIIMSITSANKALISKQMVRKSIRITLAIALICYLLLFVSIRAIVNPIPDSATEMYSLPYQQTARCVRDHGNDMTDDERKIIDAALTYDTLATRYDPRISDPVKFDSHGSISVNGPYFKLWFKQFFRYPRTYIAATWEQNYYLFVPEQEFDDVSYYLNAHYGYELGDYQYIGAYSELFNASHSRLEIQNNLYKYHLLTHKVPILNLFWNNSFAFYMLVILTVYYLQNKKDLSILVIFWMTIAFVIIGPVMFGHPRYMFPIIYSLPTMLSYAYYELYVNHRSN